MIPKGTTISFLFVAIVCVVLGNAACSRHAGAQATPFPVSNEVAGWVKTGDTRTFSATELWSYIDGDAERYVKAGVQKTLTADYKFQNTVEAVVDVYTMGNAQGAQTIFEGEPASQAKSLQLGDSGRLYAGSLAFCRKQYLVRIVAYKQSPEVQTARQALARGIDRRLSE
jgi:hypothetical protein